MIRKKGILSLLILAGVVFLPTLFFTDAWLERRLENLGTSLVGAKVEFDDVDLSLSDMRLSWQRLRVTNPRNTMENMIETGSCALEVEFWPLLSKKVIIETFELSGLQTGTARETDGAVKKEKWISDNSFVGKSIKRLENEMSSAPAFNLSAYGKKVNIDSVVALLNLQSPARIDSLKKEFEMKYKDWQGQLAGMEVEKEARELEAEIQALDVKKIKSVKTLQKALKSVKKIRKSVENLTESLSGTKKKLSSDLAAFKSGLVMADDWIRADYARAMSMAKLPEINTRNIGRLIFGKKIVNQVNTWLGYVAKARYYAAKIKADKPQKEQPPRLKGQDIYFYNKHARPDFWIKKISISGQTPDKLNLSGQVNNIVSDQRLINAVTDFALSGSGEQGRSVSLSGTLDYLTDQPRESFLLSYRNFSLQHLKLSDSDLLPYRIKSGRGHVESTLKLQGQEIKGKVVFSGKNLQFDFGETQKKNKLKSVIRDLIQNTNSIEFSALISGKKDRLVFTLRSNLDELFVKNLKASLGKEVQQARQKIRARVDKEVNKKRAELEKLVSAKDEQLQAEIKKYEKIVEQQLKRADDKKAEINKQKKKLEKKLKNKIKDLF